MADERRNSCRRIDASAMAWQPSPSPDVLRKRLEHRGPAESGVVTSIVRYLPGSRFPAHAHPDGEEILVLAGIFSDEHGDYPAGSFLLNPDGSRHAPSSREGCDLFVKLRQYPGDRPRVLIDTRTATWRAIAGGEALTLWDENAAGDAVDAARSRRRGEHIELVRLDPGASLPHRAYPAGGEVLVLDGDLVDEHGRHGPLTWLVLPPGTGHAVSTQAGCTFYRKTGHLA